jgi:hypothetical protein
MKVLRTRMIVASSVPSIPFGEFSMNNVAPPVPLHPDARPGSCL